MEDYYTPGWWLTYKPLLKNMSWSVGMMMIPNIMGKMFQTNNQKDHYQQCPFTEGPVTGIPSIIIT